MADVNIPILGKKQKSEKIWYLENHQREEKGTGSVITGTNPRIRKKTLRIRNAASYTVMVNFNDLLMSDIKRTVVIGR
jgi:hypothetical protein